MLAVWALTQQTCLNQKDKVNYQMNKEKEAKSKEDTDAKQKEEEAKTA